MAAVPASLSLWPGEDEEGASLQSSIESMAGFIRDARGQQQQELLSLPSSCALKMFPIHWVWLQGGSLVGSRLLSPLLG